MKNKIKLTDLSHLEPLTDEMAHLKGGDETGPWCWGCKCICECSNDRITNTNASNNQNSARNNGGVSAVGDIAIGGVISIVGIIAA